jgi:hypothetical protein
VIVIKFLWDGRVGMCWIRGGLRDVGGRGVLKRVRRGEGGGDVEEGRKEELWVRGGE